MLSAIQEMLFSLADESYKRFQCSLMPTIDPDTVIGVRVPTLRAYAKTLSLSEAEAFSATLPHTYFDENNLHAYLIERITTFDECVAAIDRFLPYVDNWATCDTMRPKVLAKEPVRLFAKCREWIVSDRPFTVRFGLETLMLYGLDENFDPAFLKLAASVKSDEYYVRMMVAWFFATALTKRYDETLPFLLERRLDVWVHNKAIQKACESRLIAPDTKRFLKTLKG